LNGGFQRLQRIQECLRGDEGTIGLMRFVLKPGIAIEAMVFVTIADGVITTSGQ
jgi:hypothetical protein